MGTKDDLLEIKRLSNKVREGLTEKTRIESFYSTKLFLDLTPKRNIKKVEISLGDNKIVLKRDEPFEQVGNELVEHLIIPELEARTEQVTDLTLSTDQFIYTKKRLLMSVFCMVENPTFDRGPIQTPKTRVKSWWTDPKIYQEVNWNLNDFSVGSTMQFEHAKTLLTKMDRVNTFHFIGSDYTDKEYEELAIILLSKPPGHTAVWKDTSLPAKLVDEFDKWNIIIR